MKITKYYQQALLLGCFFFTNTMLAEPAHQYQVEILIFSQVSAQALQSERWPAVPSIDPSNSNATLLKPISNHSSPYALLPPRDYKLTDIQKILGKYSGYRTLLHIAWQQPIERGQGIQKIGLSNLNQASDGQTDWQVNGFLTLGIKRYFEIRFNLVFSAPWAQLTKFTPHLSTRNLYGNRLYFPLKQSLRARSNELNYIDHPLFGVLLEIFPVPPQA